MTTLHPPLPAGYTARPATLDDAAAIATLWTALSHHLGWDETFTEEDIRNEELDDEGLDLTTASQLVFDAQGQLCASAIIFDAVSLPVAPYLSLDVYPPSLELHQALISWGIERARQNLARIPDDARLALVCSSIAPNESKTQVLLSNGFQHTRNFQRMLINMQQEPQAVTLPAGYRLHTYQHPDELPALVEMFIDSFQDHFGFVRLPFEERLKHWQDMLSKDALFDPSLYFIAVEEASGKMASFVFNRMAEVGDPNVGYVAQVGTCRAYRGRGLSLALLRHSFYELYRRGRSDVALYVDASSLTGATRLYERAGMHAQRTFMRYELELRPGRDLATRSLD